MKKHQLLTSLTILIYIFAAGAMSAGADSETIGSIEPPKLQLYGTVIGGTGLRLAFIHDGNSRNRIRKIKENQTIAGAVVKNIYPDRVTLVYSGREFNLKLRSPKEGAPAPGMTDSGEPADQISPRPIQLTQPMPLIQRRQLYPEENRAPEPPWQPPAVSLTEEEAFEPGIDETIPEEDWFSDEEDW